MRPGRWLVAVCFPRAAAALLRGSIVVLASIVVPASIVGCRAQVFTPAEAAPPTTAQHAPTTPAQQPAEPSGSTAGGSESASPGDASPGGSPGSGVPSIPTESTASSAASSVYSTSPSTAETDLASPGIPASAPAQRPPTPPASSTEAIPSGSVLIALAVLVLAGVLLLRLARPRLAEPVDEVSRPVPSAAPATDVLVLMASAGNALIDSGFDVNAVQSDLQDIARAYGMSDTDIIALPTAILVSAGTGGELRTRAVLSG